MSARFGWADGGRVKHVLTDGQPDVRGYLPTLCGLRAAPFDLIKQRASWGDDNPRVWLDGYRARPVCRRCDPNASAISGGGS